MLVNVLPTTRAPRVTNAAEGLRMTNNTDSRDESWLLCRPSIGSCWNSIVIGTTCRCEDWK